MTHTMKRLDNGNIELTLSIPWETIQKTYEAVLSDIVKEAEIPGFRKGKAPKEKVEPTLDKTKTYEEVIKRLLPDVYQKAITDEGIKPIVYPQITLSKAQEGEAWEITALTCEEPNVTLGDYKTAIQNLKKEKLKDTIWVPGKDGEAKGEEKKEEEKNKKPSLDELLAALYKEVKVTISALMIEQEISKLLSDLIDQTKKLGMTVDQYLASTGRTSETIRKEYEEQAKRTLTLEFALEKIAGEEKIEVTDEELNKAIAGAKTEEEKKALEKERYYLASLLRRQKTIQYIADL